MICDEIPWEEGWLWKRRQEKHLKDSEKNFKIKGLRGLRIKNTKVNGSHVQKKKHKKLMRKNAPGRNLKDVNGSAHWEIEMHYFYAP